jgi:hypothetical protein
LLLFVRLFQADGGGNKNGFLISFLSKSFGGDAGEGLFDVQSL